MSLAVLSFVINHEQDVVGARQRARQVAQLLGFDRQDQTRIATAVSEIARNAYRYAGGGRLELSVEGKTAPQVLVVRISDRGPGIPELRRILDGDYRSPTGMGLGIVGARRLMDQFQIDSTPEGTTVWLKKILPPGAAIVTPDRLGALTAELAGRPPEGPIEELQRQNQELLQVLAELRARQEDLTRVNQELDDTNRGVVALYAELDERADHLRRADELKSRFLSNMSHEFRTPLNSIMALCRLLLDGMDGELTGEQTKQVGFVRKAAEDLLELVNDVLDLAKVEAGKIVVRPAGFEVAKLFGALRGMLRPLLLTDSVRLVFDDPEGLPPLDTDEAKVSQILRNFVSNALKFTERGEVRVSAALADDGEAVAFSVADTGLGIALEDQTRIFEDFTQLDNPVQRRVKGTGLGLPLCRRLAELLGGRIVVTSTPGIGSTFSVVIPRVYAETGPRSPAGAVPTLARGHGVPVLVVEDSAEALHVYERFLEGSGFQITPARSLREAREALMRMQPAAIVLDILLWGEDAWGFLAELKDDGNTHEIPVLVVTTVDDQAKALALGADAYAVKPVERGWLVEHLRLLTGARPVKRILVIDDDEVARYLLRQTFAGQPFLISEAQNGPDGVAQARRLRPDVIFLDLVMPGMDGYHVMAELKADPATADIPVVVLTSKALDDADRKQLATQAVTVLSKATLPASGPIRDALSSAGVA